MDWEQSLEVEQASQLPAIFFPISERHIGHRSFQVSVRR